jgi:hypothetical protein
MMVSGWTRIGIIASAVWAIGAGFCTLKVTGDSDLRTAAFLYRECADIRDRANQNQREYCGQLGAKAPAIDSSDAFNKCMQEYETKNPDNCSKRSTDYVVNAWHDEWIAAIVVALVPVPFGWGFAYLGLFLVRWVRRGFLADGHP